MNTEKLIDGIAKSIERRFPNNEMVKVVISDILAIKDGFMSEEEASAMIVDLIKTLSEEHKEE
jgi:polyhydroxyalkanoate synthesis regulator phasin